MFGALFLRLPLARARPLCLSFCVTWNTAGPRVSVIFPVHPLCLSQRVSFPSVALWNEGVVGSRIWQRAKLMHTHVYALI